MEKGVDIIYQEQIPTLREIMGTTCRLLSSCLKLFQGLNPPIITIATAIKILAKWFDRWGIGLPLKDLRTP